METRAIEIIQLILKRRDDKANTDVASINLPGITQNASTPAIAYTIGDKLVIFSRRAKLLETEINSIMKNLEGSDYNSSRVIIVSLSKPSENVDKVIKSYAEEGTQFFRIQELQFDIQSHRMYMPHRIVKDDERNAIFNKYKIQDPESQIPWIDSQDPPIKWIGAKPGDVIEVIRHSDTVGSSIYYRYVVKDVNVAQ